MVKRTSWLRTSLIGLGVVAAVGLTVVGAIMLANHQSKSNKLTDDSCALRPHATLFVTIHNNQALPSHTNGSLCDVLVITNKDATAKLMAFGPHDDHVAYDGVAERLLSSGQSLTITFVKAGNFRFHDHITDKAQGTFTVSSAQPQPAQ